MSDMSDDDSDDDTGTGHARDKMLKHLYRKSRREPSLGASQLTTWLPILFVILAFVGTVAVAFSRLASIEKKLDLQTSTMHRLEGALAHMDLLDLRLANLEDETKKHEEKLDEVEYLRAQYEQQKTGLYRLDNRLTESEIETKSRLNVLEKKL